MQQARIPPVFFVQQISVLSLDLSGAPSRILQACYPSLDVLDPI
jgi:hypothetical protein